MWNKLTIQIKKKRNILITLIPRTTSKKKPRKGAEREEKKQTTDIDQHIHNEVKTSRENLTIEWVNWKKVNYMVTQIFHGFHDEVYDFAGYFFTFSDILLSKNVQIHHGSHKKLKSGISSGRMNPSSGGNQKRHLPDRITLTTAIY